MSWEKVLKGLQADKTSVLGTTETREFQSITKRIADFDGHSQTLHKDSKLLGDRELDVYKSERKLLSDLCASGPIREDVSLREGLQEWSEHIKHQEEYLNTMAADTNRAMVEPTKKLLAEFVKLQEKHKKREQLLLNYDKWNQKVERIKKKERTGQNIVKLDSYSKSLKEAKEEFEAVNAELIAYMNSLHEQRAEYLSPSISALINLQINHIGERFKFYTELQDRVSSSKPKEPADISEKFKEFKSLSIVSIDRK